MSLLIILSLGNFLVKFIFCLFFEKIQYLHPHFLLKIQVAYNLLTKLFFIFFYIIFKTKKHEKEFKKTPGHHHTYQPVTHPSSVITNLLSNIVITDRLNW